MSENTVVITEKDGTYRIENNGISEFALLGILESIVFEMKSAGRRQLPGDGFSPDRAESEAEEAVPEAAAPVPPKSNTPELRTRIGNAVKAIQGLGGEVPEFDAANATDEELQEELEALTEQYKRLKNSKSGKR